LTENEIHCLFGRLGVGLMQQCRGWTIKMDWDGCCASAAGTRRWWGLSVVGDLFLWLLLW